jgi:hypothetical protein
MSNLRLFGDTTGRHLEDADLLRDAKAAGKSAITSEELGGAYLM